MKFSISYLVNCGLVAAGPGESITEISLWIDIARSQCELILRDHRTTKCVYEHSLGIDWNTRQNDISALVFEN